MNERLDEFNVVWDSPSKDASGSMPLGNGDVALNVWVEENGDLLLLIAKSDAWDENSINLKLGRVRIKFSPNPFKSGERFCQTLRLRTAEVEIVAGLVRLRIWVDAKLPVIRVEADGDAPFEIEASVEMWRTEPRRIQTQTSDMFKWLGRKEGDLYPTIVWPDLVLEGPADSVTWCHHNENREPDAYEVNMRLQGLGEMIGKMPHPLLGRTFGASMMGDNLARIEPQKLRSRSASVSHRLKIFTLANHPSTPASWLEQIQGLISAISAVEETEPLRRQHERWWQDFWNRSWVYISGDSDVTRAEAFQVTRAYILQRFMNACAGSGQRPIKHNGSLFSVGKPDDPDFRRWGGPGFWFQNQRLIYWPMLMAGDFDVMKPWLDMYVDAMPLQRHRTGTYFHHDGAHYPETITFWGAEVSAHYGWQPFEEREHPEAETPYLKYYWTGGLELTLLLYEYCAYQVDEEFARRQLIPVGDAVLTFFDLHYPRDAQGKIRFEPAQSLETWHEAVNPLPEIAGLKYVIERMLTLPERLTSETQRERWRRMLGELPEIPIGEKNGKRVILPAEKFDRLKNSENPELYCIFPYRLFGVGKPDLQLAEDTFDARLRASHTCWSQDDIQLALLGRAEQAKEWLVKRASDECHSDSRFPAFWNAFHDWVPDVDHGGVLQMALQLMILQAEGDEIRLLPAWPKGWDVDFKLHGPQKAVISGSVRNGELTHTVVLASGSKQKVVVAQNRNELG
jgi:alpha-L-fucosidase 2